MEEGKQISNAELQIIYVAIPLLRRGRITPWFLIWAAPGDFHPKTTVCKGG